MTLKTCTEHSIALARTCVNISLRYPPFDSSEFFWSGLLHFCRWPPRLQTDNTLPSVSLRERFALIPLRTWALLHTQLGCAIGAQDQSRIFWWRQCDKAEISEETHLYTSALDKVSLLGWRPGWGGVKSPKIRGGVTISNFPPKLTPFCRDSIENR